MRDVFGYLQLRAHLYERENENTVSFKLNEIENIWFCTPKNCKRKLKQFEMAGFFTYTPGKGRGNFSYLKYKNSFYNEIETIIQRYIEKEELDAILQLMELPIPKRWFTSFKNNIEQLFGFQKGQQNIDTLRTVIKRNISTLDPRFASVTFECSLLRQLGDTLVTYDREKDSVIPHLAHHWTVNEDETIWKFYLRKGVLFHHQKTLTSHDVLYTFQQFQDPSCPYFWLVEDIENIECISDYIIVFYLVRSNPFFLRFISSENLAILPKDIPFEEKKWLGTGAFKLKDWSDNKMVLEANDQYFMERPLIDEIEFWRVPEETFIEESYELNNFHSDTKSINKQTMEPGFRFLIFNFTRSSIVHNPSFREAIYHLLDIKKMWRELGRDNLIEASSYFPSKSKPPVKSKSKIVSLLKNSGYNGETLIVMVPFSHKAKEEMGWFINETARYGINIRIHYFDMETFYSQKIEEMADFVFMGEVASIDPQLSFLGAFKNRVLLFRRFWSKEHLHFIDNQLNLFKSNKTAMEREYVIDAIENYIKKQNLLVFTLHPIRNRIFHPMIQNIQFESYGYVDFRKLWIQ